MGIIVCLLCCVCFLLYQFILYQRRAVEAQRFIEDAKERQVEMVELQEHKKALEAMVEDAKVM